MQVRYTKKARQDIIDSYLYGLENFGLQQADDYESKLFKAVELLLENPRLGRKYYERHSPPLRLYQVGKHIIAYAIDDKFISVFRVLREETDLASHLKK